MPTYLILFRESDRRNDVPPPEWTVKHKQSWKTWLELQTASGALKGGRSLTMEGNVIAQDKRITTGPCFHGDEMVGGFLLIEAAGLDAATAIVASCPVFEAGGYAEVRPLM